VEPELIARYTPTYEVDGSGNPVGVPVPGSPEPQRPAGNLLGIYCRLEPLNADRHSADLFTAFAGNDHLWTYLPHGPFATEAAYRDWVISREGGIDPFFYAIIDRETEKATGVASYLRIDPPARSIEVGWITYSPALQESRVATDAMFVMMKNVFDLGYRRYEWKCDALNQKSRKAAIRLGMTYEGTFRQATVVKDRNRDTAWFSILDSEWPTMRRNFEQWLAESNFDQLGGQLTRLRPLGVDPVEACPTVSP
jgi:RimJ/RimL family protein N-acetyltransferase